MLSVLVHSFKCFQQRCWHDADESPPASLDPLMRPLSHGEVGVSFLSDGNEREILPESALRLIDRSLSVGDYCKRNIDEVCSGVVTNVHVRGRVEHVVTGEAVDGWCSIADFERKRDADIGDHVIYDDWVGQVRSFTSYQSMLMPRHWTDCRGKLATSLEISCT